MIEFDSALDIKEIWGGVIESHEGEHYFIRNVEYAQNILPGESWTIGILFNGEAAEINNIEVKQIIADENATPRVAKEDPTPYIHYMDTTPSEYTEDIGEVYFKDLTSEADLILNIYGACCVRDQLILVMKDGIEKAQVEELAERYDFKIVGAIELTGDYQIESVYELNIDDLQSVFDKISESDLVDHVSYNYVSETDNNRFGSNDKFSGCGTDDWGDSWADSRNPSGNNWGIEAINFADALEKIGVVSSKYGSIGTISKGAYNALSYVRIGLIDKEFDDAHEDLDFAMVWNNSNSINNDHGTHVAGIMAAEFNNKKGISGTSIKSTLYGFSLTGSDPLLQNRTQSFLIKCGLVLLIANNVKIINYSLGCINDQMNIAQGVDAVENSFKKRTNEIEDLLDRLIDKGYDFLIISSAGNDNDGGQAKRRAWYELVDPDPLGYKYILTDEYNADPSKYPSGLVSTTEITMQTNAKYNSELNYITSRVKDHIICVGAMRYYYYQGVPFYTICEYSDRGERVDIVAPGGNDAIIKDSNGNYFITAIWSCIPGNAYYYQPGTSAAAPYVSGIAGLALSVDPSIKAVDLKKLIINNSNSSNSNCLYPMLDAAKVIDAVVDNLDVNAGMTPDQQNGFVIGTVLYDTGKTNNLIPVNEPAEYAEVKIYSNNKLVSIVYTDMDGTYTAVLEPGTYEVHYHYTNSYLDEINNVTIVQNDKTINDVVLHPIPQTNLVITLKDQLGNPLEDYNIVISRNENGIFHYWYGLPTDIAGRQAFGTTIPEGQYRVFVYDENYNKIGETDIEWDESTAELVNDDFLPYEYYNITIQMNCSTIPAVFVDAKYVSRQEILQWIIEDRENYAYNYSFECPELIAHRDYLGWNYKVTETNFNIIDNQKLYTWVAYDKDSHFGTNTFDIDTDCTSDGAYVAMCSRMLLWGFGFHSSIDGAQDGWRSTYSCQATDGRATNWGGDIYGITKISAPVFENADDAHEFFGYANNYINNPNESTLAELEDYLMNNTKMLNPVK